MGKAVQCLLVLCLIFILHSSQQVVAMKNLPAVQVSVLQQDCEGKYAHRLATSPDGKLIAANWYIPSNDKANHITIWDTKTGKSLDSFQLGEGGAAIDLEFSLDSRLVVAADHDTVIVWDVVEKKIVFVTEWDHVQEFEIPGGIGISPNSASLLMYGTHGGRLLNIKTGKLIYKIPLSFSHDAISFSPNGKYLLAEGSSEERLIIWNAETGEKLHVLDEGTEGKFSPNSKYILTPVYPISKDKDEHTFFIVWDASNYKPVHHFIHPRNSALSDTGYYFNFSPDGNYVAINTDVINSGTNRGVLELWDLNTFTIKHKLELDENVKVGEHQFLPNSQYVITLELGGSAYNVLRLWDVTTGKQVSVNDKLSYISSFSPLPDNKHIAIYPGEDGTVELWDVFTGKKVRSYC